MKMRSRLTALVLAVLMLISTAAPALATTALTLSDYQGMVDSAASSQVTTVESDPVQTSATLTTTSELVERTAASAVLTAAAETESLAEQSVVLPIAGSLTLDAAVSGAANYQWQVNVGGVWANIVGDVQSSITLTYPMLSNALADGSAKVRCRMTVGEEVWLSAVANVTVDETINTTTVTTEQKVAVETFAATQSTTAAKTRMASVSTFNATRDASQNTKYQIQVNYLFPRTEEEAEDKTAADSHVAQVGSTAGTNDYVAVVPMPQIVGYQVDTDALELVTGVSYIAPNNTYVNGALNFNIPAVTQDININVYYVPALVNFKVMYFEQNIDDDGYSPATTNPEVIYEGYTGATIKESYPIIGVTTLAPDNKEGFKPLIYDEEVTIAANGSTVINIYYDRLYYLMEFDLQGGTGVEPIYARYGTPVSISNPTRKGYTFAGWDKDIESTVPAKNTNYTASWTAQQVTYDVVFWYENADDTNYSQAGVLYDRTGLAGSAVDAASYQNSAFEGRDSAHFTFDAEKTAAENKDLVIAGDGSTVVNVYFSRNEYTITYSNARVLTCTREEHVHSDACCEWGGLNDWHTQHSNNCCELSSSERHTHNNNCYTTRAHTVTAKYDSDITYVWQTDPIKSMLDDGYVFESNLTGDYYSFLEKMPGQNITMKAEQWSGSNYTWYYYLEVLPGMDTTGLTTRTDKNVTYYQYDSTTVKYGDGLGLTYDEDYYPITGFTQRDNEVPDFVNRTAYLYYRRNSYTLTFSNVGSVVPNHGGTFMYEADISGEYFEPEYPDESLKDVYEFKGWYTSPYFGDTEFAFTTTDEDGNVVKTIMPANDITLYAKWEPVTHTVRVYKTDALDEQLGEDYVVTHGETTSTAEKYPADGIPDPEREPYNFTYWFYKDAEGNEKAFSFDATPVTSDVNVYAKWSSNSIVRYVVYYAKGNGEAVSDPVVYVADATKGSALVGTTKTFEAKDGSELYEGYQVGWFPLVKSHSFTIDIEEKENTFTFVYVERDSVPYTVYYVDEAGNNLLDPKVVNDNKKVVVTENFEVISGYTPDEYQKRLVVTADGNNEIVFVYKRDEKRAAYAINHYLVSASGNKTLYSAIQNVVTVPDDVVAEIEDIENYTYDPTKTQLIQNDTTSNPTSLTIPIRTYKDGFELNLYYYENMATINYVVASGSTGFGTVDLDQETIGVVTGRAAGSTATPNAGYKFVGWYTDDACETAVDELWVEDGKISPVKEADEVWVNTTYYAKFELCLGDLIINKTVNKSDFDGGTFTFNVIAADGTVNVASINIAANSNTGTATVEDLVAGEYTVTETSTTGYTTTMTCGTNTVTDAPITGVAVPAGGVATVNVVNTASEMLTIPVTKVWDDKNDMWGLRPDEVTIQLVGKVGEETFAHGLEDMKLPVNNAWASEWTNVPKYDENGRLITYTIAETAVDKYTTVITGDVTGFTVTNTLRKYDLTIKKEGLNSVDPYASTMYQVKGKDGIEVEMTVAIYGNSSVTITDLPEGSYSVAELTDWSWRYTSSNDMGGTVTLNEDNDDETITFSNTRQKTKWLDSDCYAENRFGGSATFYPSVDNTND